MDYRIALLPHISAIYYFISNQRFCNTQHIRVRAVSGEWKSSTTQLNISLFPFWSFFRWKIIIKLSCGYWKKKQLTNLFTQIFSVSKGWPHELKSWWLQPVTNICKNTTERRSKLRNCAIELNFGKLLLWLKRSI